MGMHLIPMTYRFHILTSFFNLLLISAVWAMSIPAPPDLLVIARGTKLVFCTRAVYIGVRRRDARDHYT